MDGGLSILNKSLVNEKPQTWKFFPIFPSLYNYMEKMNLFTPNLYLNFLKVRYLILLLVGILIGVKKHLLQKLLMSMDI